MAIRFNHNPTKSTRLTRPFGYMKHPVTGKYQGHNGIDIGAVKPGVQGDLLYAVADGTVIISKVNNGGVKCGYGYYIVIQHAGFATLYGHQVNLKVKAGQTVRSGEIIGYMGNTGTSTGTHLHFGLTNGSYYAYRWLDPAPYLLTGSHDSKAEPSGTGELGKEKERDEEVVTQGKLQIDGTIYSVDRILKDDTNYIKLRSFEQAGYRVGFDGLPTIEMPCASVDFEFRGKKFSVNGVNDNGTNKVEARALLEAMGFKVSWDDGKVVVE